MTKCASKVPQNFGTTKTYKYLGAIFLIHSLKDASDFINYQYTFISLFLREGGEQRACIFGVTSLIVTSLKVTSY